MAGLFISVGEGNKEFGISATTSLGMEIKRGIGTAQRSGTAGRYCSYVEWNQEDNNDSDVMHVTNQQMTLEVFLIGYLTEPWPISGKLGLSNEDKLLEYGERLVSEESAPEIILKDLNGSFVLVAIDLMNLKIKICSDRLASRTIWHLFLNQTWCLASSPALLFHIIGHRSPVQAAALGALLLRARPGGEKCLLSSMSRNISGYVHTLTKEGHEGKQCWYEPRYLEIKSVRDTEWAERLVEALKGSARRLSKIVKRPLLFLSGGLDSRLALAALSSSFQVTAVTLQDTENYETRIARQVASAMGIRHHVFRRDKSYYLRVLEQSALLQGGIYHPTHAHFSECLRKLGGDISYDAVLLGDFLEAFQKLFGDGAERIASSARAEDIFPILLQLDGKYAVSSFQDGLSILNPVIREQVFEEWRSVQTKTIYEAFRVTTNSRLAIDYLLRWRAAYELATYCMIEDVRSYAPERCLSMDNELHSLLLSMPSTVRASGNLTVSALERIAPCLARICNANSFIPANAPQWCHHVVKAIRPRVGKARRRMNYYLGITGGGMSSSWSDLRLMMTKNEEWVTYLEGLFLDQEAFPETIFRRDMLLKLWHDFKAGDFTKGFSLDSLLTFGIVHKRFGSGTIQ